MVVTPSRPVEANRGGARARVRVAGKAIERMTDKQTIGPLQ